MRRMRMLLFACTAAIMLGACQLMLVFDPNADALRGDAVAAGEDAAPFDSASDDDAIVLDASVTPSDATVVSYAPESGLPSYCDGVTAHFTFDNSLDGALGRTANASGSPPYVAGRMNQAIEINGTYWLSIPTFNADVALPDKGSIAFWMKAAWSVPCASSHPMFELRSSTGPMFFTGPDLACDPSYGLALTARGTGGFVVAATTPAAFGNGAWDHVVATWDRAQPRLELIVNGNVGPRAAYAPSTATWPPAYAEVLAEIQLGTPSASLNGYLDEFTVWNRDLTAAEATTLAGEQQSVREACALK